MSLSQSGHTRLCLRRNEVQDAFSDLASLVWNPSVKEPAVTDGSDGIFELLVADLCVRGIFQLQT